MTNPAMKPILGYPGYYITQDGQVFSTQRSSDGKPKPLKTLPDGSVRLMKAGKQRQIKVAELLKKTWKKDA